MKQNTALSLLRGRDQFLTSFDTVFDRILRDQWPGFDKELGVSFFQGTARPRVNIKNYDDKVQITAEISGLSKDEVNVEVKDGILTLSGEKKLEKEDTSGDFILKELSHAKFQRSFELGENLDSKNIVAEFKNGTLTLDIPKTEPKKNDSYRIEIK